MKLAVISDIHGNVAALEAVLEDINRQDVDEIVNLGDNFSGPFDAAGTAKILLSLDIATVRGNHDRLLVDQTKDEMGLWETWAIDDLSADQIDWQRDIPPTLILDHMFLCHATPDSDERNWLDHRGPEDRMIARDLKQIEALRGDVASPVILCGHTHTPRIVRLPNGQVIVNPGSVGCPAYLDTRSSPNFIHQTGSADARYAIVHDALGQWTADMRAIPYDSSRMAALAKEKGADSWARAVTTGWFA